MLTYASEMGAELRTRPTSVRVEYGEQGDVRQVFSQRKGVLLLLFRPAPGHFQALPLPQNTYALVRLFTRVSCL
jgi:hypothetical protein